MRCGVVGRCGRPVWCPGGVSSALAPHHGLCTAGLRRLDVIKTQAPLCRLSVLSLHPSLSDPLGPSADSESINFNFTFKISRMRHGHGGRATDSFLCDRLAQVAAGVSCSGPRSDSSAHASLCCYCVLSPSRRSSIIRRWRLPGRTRHAQRDLALLKGRSGRASLRGPRTRLQRRSRPG